MPLDTAAARAVIARYPSPRSAILPLFWMGQEADGYVTRETAEQVAELLDLPLGEVESVLSFYTMFRRQPAARCRLQVCRSLACSMHGADEILRAIAAETGVVPGTQSADGGFSVEVVECIAACDHAPAYLFNERMGGPLDRAKALALLRGTDGGEIR
jgi:NADH:ubiquinone oxidoreductase subunit E